MELDRPHGEGKEVAKDWFATSVSIRGIESSNKYFHRWKTSAKELSEKHKSDLKRQYELTILVYQSPKLREETNSKASKSTCFNSLKWVQC